MYKWKGLLQRIKNEVEQKEARSQFWYKKNNNNKNLNNVYSLMNPIFI